MLAHVLRDQGRDRMLTGGLNREAMGREEQDKEKEREDPR